MNNFQNNYQFDYNDAPADAVFSALECILNNNPSMNYNSDMSMAFKIYAVYATYSTSENGYSRWLMWRNKENKRDKRAEWRGFERKSQRENNLKDFCIAIMKDAKKNYGWDDSYWRNQYRDLNDNFASYNSYNNVKNIENKELTKLYQEQERLQNILKYKNNKYFEKNQKNKKILYLFQNIYDNSKEHPYTTLKNINLSLYPDLKISQDWAIKPEYKREHQKDFYYVDRNNNKLLNLTLNIPLYDIYNGELCNLQKINYEDIFDKSQGFQKRYLSSPSQKNGTGYFLNHVKNNIEQDKITFFVGEGFATMASIYQILTPQEREKYYCVMALDATNLENVAMALRLKYPISRIIFCADNDYNVNNTLVNVGIDTCKKAINNINCNIYYYHILTPPILNNKPTDWNDLYVYDKNQMERIFRSKLQKVNEIEEEKKNNYIETVEITFQPNYYNFSQENKIKCRKNSQQYKNLEEKFKNQILLPEKEKIEYSHYTPQDFLEIEKDYAKIKQQIFNLTKNNVNNITTNNKIIQENNLKIPTDMEIFGF